ncbi:MAG: hypothetical protein Barrevirus8_5 [Barrevirus sp.]|uniref:OTU domain-containing protein n=1 Tax=Barrevirus sp. TaxID=2487763 RepID=A0A3G4ZUA9_9VIRU|nr:MAG: hypothetical protein Barrevirus8_5 [Barrevirus sp.]
MAHYPTKLNYKVWEDYVGRPLEPKEKYLIGRCKAEKQMNKMMKDLYCQLIKKELNYYVPKLTALDGNCLFESLNYYGIGTSVQELRSVLSMVFYLFQNYKNFLPGQEASLGELFSFTNEIEYVYSKEKDEETGEKYKKYYKYTYQIMCQDMNNMSSWQRLPTQLILLVVSYLYKSEIVIINSSTGYETVINAYESVNHNHDISKIYLGQLEEFHYLVLDVLEAGKEFTPLFYTEARDNLSQFGTFIQISKLKEEGKEEKNKEEDENKDNKEKVEIDHVIFVDLMPSTDSSFTEIKVDNLLADDQVDF